MEKNWRKYRRLATACFTITRYNAGISLSTRAGARVHASRGVHRHRASSSASPPPLLLLLLFSSRRSVHLVFVPFVIEPMKRSSSKNGILRGSFFLLFFGKIELTASTIHFQEKKKRETHSSKRPLRVHVTLRGNNVHTRRDLNHRSLEGIFRGENFEREDGRRMVVPRVVTPCSMRGLDERRGISLLAATGLTFFARSHATQYTLVDDKRQPPRPPRVATPVRQATRRCSRAIVTISSGERRMRFSKFKSRAQGHRGYSSSSSSFIFSSLFLASDESNRERSNISPHFSFLPPEMLSIFS